MFQETSAGEGAPLEWEEMNGPTNPSEKPPLPKRVPSSHHYALAVWGALGPVRISPVSHGCPRNKGEGLVCLDLGTRYRIRDHSLNERPGWLVLRVCFYLLLGAHETFRGLP